MILLTTSAHPTMVATRRRVLGRDLHGRLLTPRYYSASVATARSGIPWAADNDAFSTLDLDAFERMVETLAEPWFPRAPPGLLFVVAPDVPGDAWLTLRAYWEEYASLIIRWQLPPAFVTQDGIESVDDVPWGSLDALFLAGSDEFRFGAVGVAIAREAKLRGKHLHIGRVNSMARLRQAFRLGADSVDGSSWARWRDVWLAKGLDQVEALHRQTTLDLR